MNRSLSTPKRILSLAASIGFCCAAFAQEQASLGDFTVAIPKGWTQHQKKDDLLTYRSTNSLQQVTVSTLHLGTDASFADFEKLCKKRIEAEKTEFVHGFIEPGEPFKAEGLFGMFFSGGDKTTGRMFSGYLVYAKQELLTVYVESNGVTPKDHLDVFHDIVKGVKRK